MAPTSDSHQCILHPQLGGSPSALPAAPARCPSFALPPFCPGPTMAFSPTPEPGQWLSSLPVTFLALPPGSEDPHPFTINPVSLVPGTGLALSGCMGNEWEPHFTRRGTRTDTDQGFPEGCWRVLGAPSPSPDPKP